MISRSEDREAGTRQTGGPAPSEGPLATQLQPPVAQEIQGPTFDEIIIFSMRAQKWDFFPLFKLTLMYLP